ncbi:hypothetical protein [Rhodoferax saidenbachensis]|uniref:Uncharacterized protein n=1 Tax=Rhodoferax saidenbachensis TaxID=1484693 RepID=A0ABU1ZQK3_9BURK|nr:hypothetical protein [Rhodoferax saidenbachensis]MDR7307849.1 hypothetical protein [Rhodoferax saidenbachensis]
MTTTVVDRAGTVRAVRRADNAVAVHLAVTWTSSTRACWWLPGPIPSFTDRSGNAPQQLP